MFLGVDVGTSSVKAILIDDDGTPVSEGAAPLNVSRPNPLWSEQNPSDWWAATNMAIAQLDITKRAHVRAVGLSGQMHGATLLDAEDNPLRPAILWNDGRSHAECEELAAREPGFMSVGGNLVMPGFTAPKLAWVRRHEPDLFAQIQTVLLPKDYVRLRMTGERASDMSDSAGTLWLDVAEREWSERLLAACELTKQQMPALFEGPEVTGRLRAEAAEAWGMERVPVVAGGGDNAAGAAGVGVIADGEALLSLGTSGVIFLATSDFRPYVDSAVHAFCHALPGRWHQMSVMLSAASCLDWAAALTGQASPGDLIELAQTGGRIGISETFLPYLSGERTPHNNPHASGVLFGLGYDSDPAAIGQAVLEGVAHGLSDGLAAIEAPGSKAQTISVIGGGSRSLYWGRVIAAAMNRPLIYRDGAAAGPALGAARLARFGLDGGAIDDVFASPHVLEIIEPHEDDVEAMAHKRARHTSLYRRLTPEFAQGSDHD